MAPKVRTLSLTEIADEFGVTTRTIQNWREAKMPSRTIDGAPRFVLKECIRWVRENDVEEAVGRVREKLTGGKLDKDQEMAAKIAVERELKELELRERRGLLIDAAVYRERCEEFVGGFASVTTGRLQAYEREVVQALTPADARRLMTKIQTALMKGAQEYADALEAEIAATEQTEEAA